MKTVIVFWLNTDKTEKKIPKILNFRLFFLTTQKGNVLEFSLACFGTHQRSLSTTALADVKHIAITPPHV